MTPRTTDRWLMALLVLGLVARLVVLYERLPRPIQGDEPSYDSIAWNVASGHGYVTGSSPADWRPTAVRGPGYVLYLAAFYRVFGHRVVPPLAAQAVLDVLTAWLVARLAMLWFADRRIALVAAGLYAFYPPFLLNAALLMTETTSQFAVVAAVLLFFEHLASRKWTPLVASGAALGWCALSKPQLAPIGIVLAACSLGVVGWRSAVRAATIVTLTVGLVMAPWIARNFVVYHTFIPGVSIGGLGLWLGAGPYGGRPIGGLDAPEVPDSVRAAVGRMDELGQNRWALAETKRIVAAHPLAYAALTVRKTLRLWFNLGFEGHAPSRASWATALCNAALLLLAVAGALRAGPRPPATVALVGLGVFWTAVYAPFFTVVRYAHPYYALLMAFTAAGLVALLGRGRDG